MGIEFGVSSAEVHWKLPDVVQGAGAMESSETSSPAEFPKELRMMKSVMRPSGVAACSGVMLRSWLTGTRNSRHSSWPECRHERLLTAKFPPKHPAGLRVPTIN